MKDVVLKINIKLDSHDIKARACIVSKTKDEKIEITSIKSVNLKNSKTLHTEIGDFGLVIFNDSFHGFLIEREDLTILEERLEIKAHCYDDFIENLSDDLTNTVINLMYKI